MMAETYYRDHQEYQNSLEYFQERLLWHTLSEETRARLLQVYEKSQELYQKGTQKKRRGGIL